MLIYVVTVNNTRLAFVNEDDALRYALQTYEFLLKHDNTLSEDDKEMLYQSCKRALLLFSSFETDDGFLARMEVLPLVDE